MSFRYPGRIVVPTTIFLAVSLCSGAVAKDVFLTIGGGPEPSSNQVSLESNVQFFGQTINAVHLGDRTSLVFFADGNITKRDLQYQSDRPTLTEGGRWLVDLFGDLESSEMRYRDSDVPGVTGPTRKSILRQQFYELADTLTEDDRLFLYVTAHGGPAENSSAQSESEYYDYELEYYGSQADINQFNTTISLWNNEDLSAAELTTWLDDIHPKASVIMVMAQCFAGGFARTIFQNADPSQGLVSPRRCGFFSQRHDAPSTGCTSLVDQSTYRDYSTYFWEAIGGLSRTGNAIDPPDYNGDGVVALNEAHAYSMIVADSMDVPLLTSDVLLRRYSRIAKPLDAEPDEPESQEPGFFASLFGGKDEASRTKALPPAVKRLLTRDQTIDQCMSIARPEQAAVITALAEELSMNGGQTILEIQRRVAKLSRRRNSQETLWTGQLMANSNSLTEIRNAVLREYPELQVSGPNPTMLPLMADGPEAREFVAFIDDYPISANYLDGVQKADRLRLKHDRLENQYAKAVRLKRMLDTVLLQTNLRDVASAERTKAVLQLISMESASIASP